MRVEVDLPNPENLLCDGMYGKAIISLERDARSLALPAACVVEHNGQHGGVVFVVRDGIARRTEVKLGGDNGTQVEVVSGISPEDAVVLPAGTPMEDGMRVVDAARQTVPNSSKPNSPALSDIHPQTKPGTEADQRMNGLIHASLRNPIAVTVMVLAITVLGGLSAYSIPIDILPVFKSPAVQALVFYSGMPAASIEKNITARLERGVVQASGGRRIESRSIVGISIVRDYFRSNVDRSGAMTEVNSLAGWEYPTMPPGTLPPVVLPYDPTSVTPVCLVALDSQTQNEATLFDVGRYEVRPQIMSQPGAISPLVYGGKVRAVMMYLDRVKMQARHLSPMDVMKAVDEYNVFLPTGSAKFGSTDYAIDSNSMFDLVGQMEEIPLRNEPGNATFLRDVATPKDANFIQTNVVRVNGKREVYVPVFRQLGSSTLQVVNTLQGAIDKIQARLTRPGIDLKVVMDQSVYVRHSIESLVEEGVLGAVLCSLVILLVSGRVADDGHRRLDHSDRGPGALDWTLRHGEHPQRDDPGRAFAGDRADGR